MQIMQLAAGGLPVRRRRKYRNYEKRLMTIREKYEAGDYSLSVQSILLLLFSLLL